MSTKVAVLLEDNKLYRDVMTEVLTENDFAVMAYPDPSQLLSKCQICCSSGSAPCADILISDNQMPGMNGHEFMAKIKLMGCKLPDHSKAIISGCWSDREYSQAQQLGCHIFHKATSIDVIYSWLDSK